MENEIKILGQFVRPNATDELLDLSMHEIIKNAVDQFKVDYPEQTINSAVVTTTEFYFKSVERNRVVVNVWLTGEVLVIKDVGIMMLGGYIPLPTTGASITVGEGTVITRGYLWKNGSYTSSYDLHLDALSRALIEEHISCTMRAAINNKKKS